MRLPIPQIPPCGSPEAIVLPDMRDPSLAAAGRA
jgi:hypothetical protein